MQYNAVDMSKLHRTFLVISVLLVSACVPAEETNGPELMTPAPSEQIRTATPTESPQPADNVLRLWLAPAFDPDDGSPAGMLLRQRLDLFESSHSGVEVEIRIKEETGVGGLYQSLATAMVAAPSVTPDIISLNPESLRAAAIDGLILPLETFLEAPASPAWYDHTVSIARIEGNFYGRPIASETEILAYRTFLFQTPPMTWSNILAGPESFLFPANDPAASFSLAQYLALDGSLVDDAGDPALDPIVLTEVLTFYDSAWNSDILSTAALQYASATETWQALVAERATSAVAPLDEFLLESDLRVLSAVPLPTQTEPGIGFAKTWSLAIVDNDSDHQELAAQMIDWLTDPEFLGPWTHALGMLPPTNLALSQWPEGPETSLASSLVTIMRPELPPETLAVFGPPIRDAIVAVIRDGVKPSNAAVSVAQSIASGQTE
jgi:ABC-type glycerol-3-phosphate transport system substrate-binding protein